MRIGHGFDAHRFADGVALVLGGVKVPYDRGLAGHSDGDVVIHALCDALLGAAALGDIGKHFPDTSDKFHNIDSRILLRTVAQKIFDQLGDVLVRELLESDEGSLSHSYLTGRIARSMAQEAAAA